LVSLNSWDYEKRSGLGGSAAWALLNGEDGVDSELNLGAQAKAVEPFVRGYGVS
jgi:hypothetical protein